jgi:hypothetical protein
VGYYGGYYGGCGQNRWRCRGNYPRYGYVGVAPRATYYGGYYATPRYAGRMSCGTARNLVDNSGFNKVRARDCGGKIYSFYATRKGAPYLVRVNAYTGRIVGSGRI